jgi:heme exporter protein B
MGRRQFSALLRKDLLIELRTREMLLSMFLFAVLSLVVFHYAFDPKGGADLTPLAGGMLWVVFLFAALLGLNRSFAREQDEGCLDGLLLCPADRVVVFLAKAAANFIFLAVIQILVVPVLVLFYVHGGIASHSGSLALVVFLADVGFAVLGTLLATMAAGTRARDLLLPVAFLPLVVPLLIAATSATTDLISGGADIGDLVSRLGFLAGYDAVFLVVAYGTYDYLLSE